MAITFTPEWFQTRWSQAKNRAGKRYTEQLDVPLDLKGYFSASIQSSAFFSNFEELLTAFRKILASKPSGTPPDGSTELLARLTTQTPSLISTLEKIVSARQNAPIETPLAPANAAAREVGVTIDDFLGAVRQNSRRLPESVRSGNEAWLTWLSKLGRQTEEIENVLASPMTSCTNVPLVLLLGPAGTGKTHLLCEMTRQCIEEGAPALLFLAQAFQTPFNDVLKTLASSVGWTDAPGELFGQLNAIGRAGKRRCLISIDAINEGHRSSWTQAIPHLANLVRQHPGLAVVISCRTPFEKLMVANPGSLGFTVAHHFGFPPETQSEAIEKYFKAYGIPLPEVPQLEEEFSNPLFLKLFCEALEKVTVKARHKQIREIAAGQRGMTHILEYFIDQKDRSIAVQLGTQNGLAWKFLKEEFTAFLATKHRQAVPLADAVKMADAFQPVGLPSGDLLQALINEDILSEDVEFSAQSQPEEVVRLTYQKFADHLLARKLLADQLDGSNKARIKASLRDPGGLGFYFKDELSALAEDNVVQALLIEFPTRIKNRGELLDYLDWKGIPIRLCEVFVEGLYWREPKSINKSTARWVVRLMSHPELRKATLNVLVALSVKPRHPFRAGRLDRFLRKGTIIDRDLFWTEYLRHSFERGTPTRLLIWAEHVSTRHLSAHFARAYISVLKWFLTSTNRSFRDRATHTLFRLGLERPAILFRETLASLSINDPYVPERMLAASYGVAMAVWGKSMALRPQQRALCAYARGLFALMFRPSAVHGTTHILARDYAFRTIELALKVNSRLLSQSDQRRTRPPFRTGGIRKWGQSKDKDEDKYRSGDAPLGMDFANYTLGRLVPDRMPYDNKHSGYNVVRRQIMWRIYDLGYKLKTFSAIDQDIANAPWRYGRASHVRSVERYGKKYAWIAYYELAGYRSDHGLLPEREIRISDADIDPSFPTHPIVSRFFPESWIPSGGSVAEWIRGGHRPTIESRLAVNKLAGVVGPWMVLYGSASQGTEDRTIFTLFQGMFVGSSDLPRAIEILSAPQPDVGRAIPRPEEEHYTYGGEVPWCDTWRPQLYPASLGPETAKVTVSLPVREYSWESYHSDENKAGGITFPSKDLAEALDLYVQIPHTTMAVRGSKKPATVFVHTGEGYSNYEALLLLRRDLLNRYLRQHELAFLLFAWGERRANYSIDNASALEGTFEIKDVVHEQGFVYNKDHFERFL